MKCPLCGLEMTELAETDGYYRCPNYHCLCTAEYHALHRDIQKIKERLA